MERRSFPCYLFVKFIVRRTTSFYNKEAILFLLEKGCEVSNACCRLVECRIISVSAYSTNCEIVLTYELVPCYEWFSVILWNLCNILSDECFNQQWAISLFIFLCAFMYSELWTSTYNILYACFTIHYSSLNITFLPRDRSNRIS